MPNHVTTLSIGGLTLRIEDDATEMHPWLGVTCQPFHVVPSQVDKPFPINIHRDPSFTRGQDAISFKKWEEGGFEFSGYDFSVRRESCGAPIQVNMHPDGGIGGVLRWVVSMLLIEAGGLLVHAASFASEGSGVMLPGMSGRGKTTLSRLLQPRVHTFTDEATAVRMHGEIPMIYATPFAGELGAVSGQASAPLETLFLLRHTENHALRKLKLSEVVAELAGCVFIPVREDPWLQTYFERVEILARSTFCYELQFRPTPDVWEVIRDVIHEALPA